MKNGIITRKHILTAILLALMTIGLFQAAGLRTLAAKESWIEWTYLTNLKKTDQTSLEVEVNQSFYIGDLLNKYVPEDGWTYYGLTGTKGMTFYTSDAKTVSINKKTGYVKTRKTGTAKITVKYKGEKYVCNLTVVARGRLGSRTAFRKVNQYAKQLFEKRKTKVTSKNIVALMKLCRNYQEAYKAAEENGVLTHVMDGVECGVRKKNGKYQLVVPLAMQCRSQEGILAKVEKYLILDDDLLSEFKIRSASVSASRKTVKIKLKKKVTAHQLARLQYSNYLEVHEGYPDARYSRTKGYFTAWVEFVNQYQDVQSYGVMCIAAKGSDTLTVKMGDPLEQGIEYTIWINDSECVKVTAE